MSHPYKQIKLILKFLTNLLFENLHYFLVQNWCKIGEKLMIILSYIKTGLNLFDNISNDDIENIYSFYKISNQSWDNWFLILSHF